MPMRSLEGLLGDLVPRLERKRSCAVAYSLLLAALIVSAHLCGNLFRDKKGSGMDCSIVSLAEQHLGSSRVLRG